MTDASVLSETDRQKRDSRPDDAFYESPRFVVHADEGFLDRLTELYASTIPDDARVLDAMSSWVSHLPDAADERVVGHGLNAAELRENDQLDDWFVQDLNADQHLPLADDAFDAVFGEFERVLADDGVLVVSFSNRLFPTKAVHAWRMASMRGREDLVRSYVDAAGGFDAARVVRDQPETDPFHAVVART
jgi:hypothetical protein